MDSNKPKVSVVIPTYNRADILIGRSVKSIREQTFKDWECVIVDDGSTDDTEEKVRALMQQDPRIRYFKKENAGQARARNLGIRNARGDYIAFTDDDDVFLPAYLEVAVKTFESLPDDVTHFCSDFIVRDYRGRETYATVAVEPFWKCAVGGSWFVKREVFFKDNLFFDETTRGFEDIDLNIRFHFAGKKAYIIHEPLHVYYASIGSGRYSESNNYGRQLNLFEHFFEKYENLYRELGDEAWAWICRFGGIVNLEAGRMAEGRRFLWQAVRAKPRLLDFIYIATSFLGYRLFMIFDAFKIRTMRLVRIYFLNRFSAK